MNNLKDRALALILLLLGSIDLWCGMLEEILPEKAILPTRLGMTVIALIVGAKPPKFKSYARKGRNNNQR